MESVSSIFVQCVCFAFLYFRSERNSSEEGGRAKLCALDQNSTELNQGRFTEHIYEGGGKGRGNKKGLAGGLLA